MNRHFEKLPLQVNPYFFIKKNQGQMAIFVALIFQVLFVFFAMVINVGLVVHDKINLQNSVDLAAYYGAAKQAEVLTAIAHSNYQIRQSWKLYAWRYKVLGTMGLTSHPARQNAAQPDVPYPPALGPGGNRGPAACVVYNGTWLGAPPDDNLCKQQSVNIPPPPIIPTIAFFNPVNLLISSVTSDFVDEFNSQCSVYGAYNRWFALNIQTAFRMDMVNRKQVILSLAENLSNNDSPDFKDLDGSSVQAGIQNTLIKNLTHENFGPNGENLASVQMFNSLQNIRPDQWLPEIRVFSNMLYMDVNNSSGCNAASPPPTTYQAPQRGEAQNFFNTMPQAAGLLQFAGGEPTDIYAQSIGYEKNPWYMAYVGVKATTTPRQVFFPFGEPVSFTARAFAKPFGGRIGPWYGGFWPQSAQTSSGPDVDVVAPPRISGGGFTNALNDPTVYPNYSRYPGDTLGVNSRLGQASLTSQGTPANFNLDYSYLANIALAHTLTTPGDPLSWNNVTDSAPRMRNYELAIVAPNLFDVTYYTILPNYAQTLYPRILANRDTLGIPSDIQVRADLGYRNQSIPAFSVRDQMAAAQGTDTGVNLQLPNAFYFMRNWRHVLTAWTHPAEMNLEYRFPEDRFGNCLVSDEESPVKVLGGCINGGRAGYSVKIVSKEALESQEFQIGGQDQPAAGILNPPVDF